MNQPENNSEQKNMKDIVALCKRRGFIFQASEIYGGINGFWDYGSLGVELKNNLRDLWWKAMVITPPIGPDGHPVQIVGIDSSIIQNPKTWEASGHVGGFSDPMQSCLECKKLLRADHVREMLKDSKWAKQITENDPQTTCPHCGGKLTSPREFNLMFETHTGPVRDDASKTYLRPETAQGIFLNYKNVLDTARVKMPFGIAQIGKAFRNEVTPRNFIFRSREFEQMEMEWFCHPDEAKKWRDFWFEQRLEWWKSLGLSDKNLKVRDHDRDELSHYAREGLGTADIEYRFPFTYPGFGELEGIAHRCDFDLKQHQEHSKQKMEYLDPARNNERYLPHVIEPASGLTRGVLALLCEAYTTDKNRPSGVYLNFHPKIAPKKAAILPLTAKNGHPEKAEKLYMVLREEYAVDLDIKQNIGKRYARQDEIGTPYCFTIDNQTLEDDTVTSRDRNTMQQERIHMDNALDYMKEKMKI